jgi:hypothetical protein
LRPDRVIPGLTMALLMNAAGEVKSQPVGSRVVRRSPRLAWDILVSLYGGEDALRRAIDETRNLPNAPPNFADVLSLADKYASGWRPSASALAFGEDDAG